MLWLSLLTQTDSPLCTLIIFGFAWILLARTVWDKMHTDREDSLLGLHFCTSCRCTGSILDWVEAALAKPKAFLMQQVVNRCASVLLDLLLLWIPWICMYSQTWIHIGYRVLSKIWYAVALNIVWRACATSEQQTLNEWYLTLRAEGCHESDAI